MGVQSELEIYSVLFCGAKRRNSLQACSLKDVKFAERRYPIAARQYDPADLRIRVPLRVEPIADFGTVDDYQLPVRGPVDIEFHAVYAQLLRIDQTRYRIFV